MSVEECFDLVVSGALDPAVVVIIDVAAESDARAVEPTVVVGVVVTDVRAGGKRGALVDAERIGAADSPTTNNGRLSSSAVRDAVCEVMVFAGEVEPSHNRVAQLDLVLSLDPLSMTGTGLASSSTLVG